MLTPYLYVPFIAWLLARLTKTTIEIIMVNVDIRYIFAAGGMPSTHTAVVVSLAATPFIIFDKVVINERKQNWLKEAGNK